MNQSGHHRVKSSRELLCSLPLNNDDLGLLQFLPLLVCLYKELDVRLLALSGHHTGRQLVDSSADATIFGNRNPLCVNCNYEILVKVLQMGILVFARPVP